MNKAIILTVFAALFLQSRGADLSNSIELTQLYIVGDATSTSWDLGRADEMHRIDNGVFEWTGKLEGGKDFKFMNTREGWHKHIVSSTPNIQAEKNGLYPLSFYANWALDGKYDCKFHVAESGVYTIIADLNSMRMTIKEPMATAKWPDKFYLTGSALEGKVVEIPAYGGVEHKITLDLKPGKIKLMDTPRETQATHYYRPIFEDIDLTFGADMHAPLLDCSENRTDGWNVGVGGTYKFYLNNQSQTYRFSTYTPCKELYLVGGCCEKAWDYWSDSNCVFLPHPENPDILVWEGELRIGWEKKTDANGKLIDPDEPTKFKILTARDWFRDTYHPYIADAAAEGESHARITGGDDIKWTISRNGVYRLEMNTLEETLTGTFIEPVPDLPDNNETNVTAGVNSDSRSDKIENISFYNLMGIRIPNPGTGIFIMVSEGTTKKILLNND